MNVCYYTCYSGELPPGEVIKLMKQCNPPVGWGILCPLVVTYRVSIILSCTAHSSACCTWNSVIS